MLSHVSSRVTVVPATYDFVRQTGVKGNFPKRGKRNNFLDRPREAPIEEASTRSCGFELARRLRNQGVSLRQIARELDAPGYCASNGRPFVSSTVLRMVKGHAPRIATGWQRLMLRSA